MEGESINPYAAPQVEDARVVPPMESRALRWLLAIVLFPVTAFLSWLIFLIVFFATSTAYWPGYACAVPALLVAIAVSRWVLRSKVFQNLSLNLFCTILATIFGSYLTIYWIIGMVANPHFTRYFFPRDIPDVASPVFIVVVSSPLGMLLGSLGAVLAWVRGRRNQVILCSLSVVPCAAYTIIFVYTLLFATDDYWWR